MLLSHKPEVWKRFKLSRKLLQGPLLIKTMRSKSGSWSPRISSEGQLAARKIGKTHNFHSKIAFFDNNTRGIFPKSEFLPNYIVVLKYLLKFIQFLNQKSSLNLNPNCLQNFTKTSLQTYIRTFIQISILTLFQTSI